MVKPQYGHKVIKTEATGDIVNSPAHYTAGNIECIEAITEATKGLEGIEAHCTGCAIKYLWRWKRKNEVEDLKKAIWYINKLIELNEQGTGNKGADGA
jgi:hypothetical protein